MQKIRKFLTPLFFNFPFLITGLQMLRYYFGYIIYNYNILTNKTYIGGYMFSQQEIARGRHAIIKKLLNILIKKKSKNYTIEILEIGSFCGESTLIIGSYLQEKKINFKITCVDIWNGFPLDHANSFYLNKFNENLKNGKVFNLFKYNLKKANLLKNIKFIKGDSNKVLKKLKRKFDFIFIDGSHSYNYVFNDIKNSMKLLNNNGILTGDDYEQSYKESKHLNFKELIKKDIDSFYDNLNSKNMHPGVTLAVFEHFGNIKNFNGLFALELKNKKFKEIRKIN